ncbi:MAG: HlyD family efflux transporter periplasmic adaptor subunit [Magnetospirillum sp.]|nr:HlyD family efflux transporter periplasmic adaptor subunit [Magnetospirillum sp.]
MRRKGRLLLGLALLALGAWLVLPGLIHPISSDAVLNAEVVMIRAPIDGRLTGTRVAIGDRVAAGDALGRVSAFHPPSERRDQLALELAAETRLAAALAEERLGLEALDRDLARRGNAFRGAVTARMALALAEAEARARAAEAAHAKNAAALARKQALLAKDIVAPVAVESAAAESRGTAAGIDAARTEVRRRRAELEAARAGTFVADGFNNVPYAQQRRDEVRLKLLERTADAAAAEVKVAELTRLLAAEERALVQLADADLPAPVDGVVWQRFAAEGDGVRAGDPVLGVVDCNALFLTAVLPKRYFAELRAGDRARARLAGEEGAVAAVVQSVRAAGAAQANGSAAVVPATEDGGEVVVTLAVQGGAIGNRSDNLCQVGQRATVTFATPAFTPVVGMLARAGLGRLRG